MLVIYSLSRLARNTRDAIDLAERLNAAGADLAVIARAPFARQDVIRRQEAPGAGGCAWCGGYNRHGNLWRYGIWSDGGPPALAG